jgi:dolichol-phosphate mannosyltransferase
MLTVAGRFDCPTPGATWLHPAMLTTLVYRFGPPGGTTRPDRLLANGQCMVFHRGRLLVAGGLTAVRHHLVEDVALARHLAGAGHRVVMVDGSDLLTVRMYESLAETWSGWGRSLALPGVEPARRQIGEVAVLAFTQAAPLLRVLVRRADALDAIALALRVGTLGGTAKAYRRRGPTYWLSPLADAPAVARVAWGSMRPSTRWRGRDFATTGTLTTDDDAR